MFRLGFILHSEKWKSLSCVRLFVTPWFIQSMEFSSPEYWSGWPFHSLGDLPNSGIKLRSPALQADSLPTELSGKPLFSTNVWNYSSPSRGFHFTKIWGPPSHPKTVLSNVHFPSLSFRLFEAMANTICVYECSWENLTTMIIEIQR